MTQTLKKILIVLLVLLLSLGAQAQSSSTGWQVRISKVATLETPDAMDLKVYFSVFDPKTDLAILDPMYQYSLSYFTKLFNYCIEARCGAGPRVQTRWCRV